MTTIKKLIISLMFLAAIAYAVYEQRQAVIMANKVQTLLLQQKKQGSPSPAAPWIERYNRLQQYLAEKPNETIPEIQFANVSAWLNSIQSPINAESDLCSAAFVLRNQAQMKFCGFIADAVRQYEQANRGQFPTDVSQLIPYCDPSAGSTMVALYEIVPASTVRDPKFHADGDWIIKRKTLVNPGSARSIAVLREGRRAWYDVGVSK
jgi:hypothetical protein